MSEEESYDFSAPTKQSPVSIILLIWKYFVNIIRQFWPAILAIFIGRGSGNISTLIFFSIVIVAVSALVFAIAYYLRFSFRVSNNELFIEKGVFKKSKLNIPFERIQTLNFEEGIIHQFFKVVKIEVDTAGSSKNEFTFSALEKGKAEYLRNLVLETKSEIASDPENQLLEADHENIAEVSKDVIFKLGLAELFTIGITQNHLRTLVLLFFFLVWGLGELGEAGLNVDIMTKENAEAFINSGYLILIGSTLFLLLITIAGTSIRTILKYYNFRMFRVSEGFKIQSGLIKRKEYAALDHKIQQIKWINNPLKRIFKINQLQLKQASSVEVSTKKSIKVPGIRIANINKILSYIIGEVKYEDLHRHSIQKQYLWRILLYFGFIPWILISGIGVYYFENYYTLLSLLLIPYVCISAYVAFRKWQYRINDDILYTHQGIFENKNNIIELYKIQNVKLLQSPYQWRRDLASLKIYTAAGSVTIPYLTLDRAMRLRDYLLYKAESSKQKWY